MEIIEQIFGEFSITTDITKMDIVAIHDFLSKYSGWSDNIPFDKVKTSIEHSLNFGLFHMYFIWFFIVNSFPYFI